MYLFQEMSPKYPLPRGVCDHLTQTRRPNLAPKLAISLTPLLSTARVRGRFPFQYFLCIHV